jgi:dienelactone hydrolase
LSIKSIYSLLGSLVIAALLFTASGSLRQATGQQAFQPLTIPEDYQGTRIQLYAWLSLPPGAGPFAAIILAHGCNGARSDVKGSAWGSLTKWAAWLNQQGYAALILDSYSGRGIRTICRDQGADAARELGQQIPPDLRAFDLYTAADYLAKMPQINPGKFGAIGFSHGGASVLRTAAEDNAAARVGQAALFADRGKFAAFVGMYPGCWGSVESTFNGPVLILIGDADQRTSSAVCQQLAANPRPAGGPVTLKVYPGATHSFDVEKPDRQTRFGDTLRFSPDANADAHTRIKEFLAKYLKAS